MFRTENSVGMLKTIAIIAGFSILLWSFGLPSIHFANAANITSVSDVISDSAPGVVADHTITFTTPTGIAAGQTLIINFGANFNPSTLNFGDIDFASTTDIALAASAAGQTWGVSTNATSITLTSAAGVINPGDTLTIKIGLNATFGVAGVTQIVNPAAEGSYEITFGGTMTDTGATRVVILSSVTVSATVNTIFTFSVAGTAAGTELSPGGATTTGVAASTSIPFGTLTALAATSSAHLLTVSTNAANGYVVTVQVDGALLSSTGADIDVLSNGDVPSAWPALSPVLGVESTYGHWGISSDDASIASRGTQFVAGQFIGATTTPRAVMGYNGPVNGQGVGVGTTTIGFKAEISALQEAGDDYTAVLTYIATPTF